MNMKPGLWAIGLAAAVVCAPMLTQGARAMTPVVEQWPGGISGISLSPDGKRVAWARRTATGSRLFVANLDGTGAKQITIGSKGNDLEPTWRADGALIAFASNRGGNFDLYAVRPDATGLRQLTKTPIDERAPQWSPRPFGVFEPGDIAYRTIVGRPKTPVAPKDLQLLEALAKHSNSWNAYRYKFNLQPKARFYKLMFVAGKGDAQRIATMRENGTMRQTLDTGMKGAHLLPHWERTAGEIAFARRTGQATAIYTANYPNTSDLNEDIKHPKWGYDVAQWRKSIRRVALLPTAQAANLSLNWTPNGDYVATVTRGALVLWPRLGSGLQTQRAAIEKLPMDGNFTWLSDGRTALIPVAAQGRTVAMHVPAPAPLLDVENLRDFNELVPGDRPFLARNGFVAGGNPRRQMFHVYEETDYADLPIFVTTDSVLHLNHLVFDYLLRGVETEHLAPAVIQLVDHHLSAALAQRSSASPAVRAAATGNAAFFAVAARLALGAVETGVLKDEPVDDVDALGADRAAMRKRTIQAQAALLAKWTAPLKTRLQNLPPEVNTLVNGELALIRAHSGMNQSPVFGGALTGVGQPDQPLLDTRIDYSDFIPRGHYTRSEILRRYFLMTRWLANGPFRHSPDGARRALLILAANDQDSRNRHNKVTGVLEAFVGGADDDDIAAYERITRELGKENVAVADVADDAFVNRFLDKVEALPGPVIAPSRGAAFRFFPQPYTADAEIMQSLVYDRQAPDVGTEEVPRYFALGLDVMGVLGSDRARQILDNTQFQGTFFNFGLKETEYANYDEQFAAQRQKFGAFTAADWNRNLYTRTLYSLLPLLTPAPNSRYQFTQSAAWTDKNLNTALATWAELKHDTMPKQPVSIEAGGEGGLTEAPLFDQPRGFVEPAPEVFARLKAMVQAERQTLTNVGYLSPDFKQRLDTFEALLTMLQNLERKQSVGQALTPAEVEQLRFFGAYQEHLTLVTAEGEGGSMEGNDMAIIADVASAFSTRLGKLLALQEGVGRAIPIYVAVERNSHRELACGAAFTYYEFTHPAEDRLTDEKWRQLLDTDKAPKQPNWTKSFISRTYDQE